MSVLLGLMLLGNVGCEGVATEPMEGPRHLAQASRALAGETCVTLQRGSGAATADAKISNRQPDKNFDKEPVASVSSVNSQLEHLLLRFDTSGIPSSATVSSATLTLWQTNPGQSTSLRAHAITAPWAERTVTWSSFGSAFNPSAVASLEASGPTHPALRALNLSSLVSTWVQTPSANHGVLLAQPAGKTLVDTSESPRAERHPRLEVCYSLRPHGTEPAGTSLLLQVISANGSPVPGAAVSSQGAVFPTDSSGHLLLENLPAGRFHARVDALGFTSASAVVELSAGSHVGYQVTLLPLPAPIPFQAEEGGVIETQQVRVTIPPGAVVDALGQPVTGPVEVTVAPLDPTTDLAAMPGPLEGTMGSPSAEPVPLESFFMAEVSLWSNGAPVNLAPGATATLEFVLPDALASQFQVGDTAPAWWFDLEAGLWLQEGEGTFRLSQTQPGKLAWFVEVSHFTWWNCDAPVTDKSCVHVQVLDSSGVPVPYAIVNGRGVSYTGSSGPTYSGADGRACIEIKRGSTANVFAGVPGQLASEAVTVTGTQTAAVCGASQCTPVQLVMRKVICTPGAYEACPYSGPAGTLGQGLCRAGRKRCNVIGTGWSACQGEVLPVAETCRSPFDDNCDGVVNESCSCSDQAGLPCYTGAPSTDGVGICHPGAVGCDLFGNVACVGQQLPQQEDCSTLADEDCVGPNQCPIENQWFWRLRDPEACVNSGLRGMAVDSQGNPLLLGWFDGTITFGGAQYTAGPTDLFVAKLDASGQPLWGHVLNGQFDFRGGVGEGSQLVVDAAGSLVFFNTFYGVLNLGGRTLGAVDQYSTLVAKFSPSGQLLWAHSLGGPNTWGLYIAGLSVDSNGAVALSGNFAGTLVIGRQVFESWQGRDFVAKLQADTGLPEWSRLLVPSSISLYGANVAMDAQSHVLVAAGFYGSFVLDGTTLSSAQSGPDLFVAKLDGTNGQALWSRVTGLDSTIDLYPQLAVDSVGNAVVFGWIPPASASLTKFSAQGQPVWSRIIATSNNPWSHLDYRDLKLDFDASANLLVSGWMLGSIDLGGYARHSLTPAPFLAWYGPNGGYLADKHYPAMDPNTGWPTGAIFNRVSAENGPDGTVILGATLQGSADLGDGPVQTLCGSDMFLLKVDPTP